MVIEKQLFLVVLLSLSCLGGGCLGVNNEGQTPPQATGSLYPLAVGNTWVVHSTEYRFDGAILATYFDTTRIVDTTRINGVKWYVQRLTSSRTPPRVAVDTVTILSSGLNIYISALEGPHLFYAFPASVGFIAYLMPLRIRVSNNDLTEAFPIGLLQHCYLYEITYSNVTTTKSDVLAPNIGFVKSTSYDSLQTPPSVYVSKRQDLSSYTLR